MNRHQEHLLGLLKEIDGFCREYGITYYCAGGTVIGAARHLGFIPWDDDIDIYMTRDEFRRFTDAFEKYGPEDRKVECYEENPEYRSMVARYYRLDTTMFCHFNLIGHSSAGTMIDIFILDPIPDDYEARHEYFAKLFVYSDLVCPVLEYSFRVPERYLTLYDKYMTFADDFGEEETVRMISSEIFDYDISECENYCLRWGSIPLIYPKDVIGTPVYLPFEDMEIPVPEKWHDYLNLHYGSSWMELPYVENQKEHVNIVSYDEPCERVYELRDQLFDQEYLLDIHRKWKDAIQDMTKLERPIEEYVAGIKNRICLEHVRINLEKAGADSLSQLYDEGKYSDIIEICGPYIKLQTDRTYIGERMRHGSQYRWNDPILIPMDKGDVSILLRSLLRSGRLGVAEKLVNAYKRANSCDGSILEVSNTIDSILEVIKMYYRGDYEGCIDAIDSIEDDGSISIMRDYMWLAKVNLGLNDEEMRELREAAGKEDASDNIIKAFGDHLWKSGNSTEAEEVYRDLMLGCRNGLFWKDIREKGIDIPPIPYERPLAFEPTEVTRIQEDMLGEIVDICEKNDISYVLGEDLGRRLFVTGNIGYLNRYLEVIMDAANAERFAEAFDKESKGDRRLLSWKEGDQIRDFSMIYCDSNSLYCDFRRLDLWKGLGIYITIRILRRNNTSRIHKKAVYLREFLLNLANLEPMDKRRMKTRKKRILYFLVSRFVPDGCKRSRAEKMFRNSIRIEKGNTSGKGYYYINSRGDRPKRETVRWSIFKDVMTCEIGGRQYRIPKNASEEGAGEIIELTNEKPKRSAFVFADDGIGWDVVTPMIDDDEYNSLDWKGYAERSKKARDLSLMINGVWETLLLKADH